MRRTATLFFSLFAIAAARPAVAQVTNDTLVMPFENPQTDAKLYWLGEGSSFLLSDFLERYGAVMVPRAERLSVFDRLQLPSSAALSHATAIKIGQIVGASDVVVGTYELAGEQLIVRTRLMRLDAGHMVPEVVERGPLTDLFGIYDRTARRLRGTTAAAPPATPGTLLTSPQAVELFIKGLVAESPTTQRAFLDQSAKLAPADDRIRLAQWDLHTSNGDHLRALDAANGVRSSSLHSRTARYLVARSQLELKKYDDAFNTLKALQAEVRSAEVLNAMGVVQLRRGSTPDAGQAVNYFRQASQAEPTDADYFFNLGYGYWLYKDPPAAIYWLREAVRRDPADGDAHFVLGAALHQTGATAEAAREHELARRLSATYESAAARPTTEAVPRGLERLKEHFERRGTRVDSIMASAGERDQAAVAAFHLDAARHAFARESDREAEHELRRALYLSPYLPQAHLLLGRIHLRGGRPPDAVQAFKIALWSGDSVAGHVGLAEAYLASQNIAAAKHELALALALDPSSVEARALRAKIGQ